jgi:transposase, IS5 family
LELKTDSYVLETNIHFPTDLNLLWDSSRKCIDTIIEINKKHKISGTRKLMYLKKKIKSQFRETSFKVFKGKKEDVKKESVKTYLAQAKVLIAKCDLVLETAIQGATPNDNSMIKTLKEDLKKYNNYAKLFCDQIYRRLLKNKVIAPEEKVFSIFESHSKWITKGKLNKGVELGHLILITTEQNQLIVDYKVMDQERDVEQVPGLMDRLRTRFKDRTIASHSFDKGIYSKENYELLNQSNIALVVLPKKGKLNKEEILRQETDSFIKMRNKHSALESNINMLEHHGLSLCRDKGIHGFKRCVGLSVLAYNLHLIGNKLIEKQRSQLQRQAA